MCDGGGGKDCSVRKLQLLSNGGQVPFLYGGFAGKGFGEILTGPPPSDGWIGLIVDYS
jgi:hypothetical protein